MRKLLSWGLYPAVLFGGVGAAYLGLDSGIRFSVVVMLVITGATLPLLLAQRFLPAERSWVGRPRDFGVDLLHMLSTGASTELWRILTVGLLYEVAAWLAGAVGTGLWPTSWPLLVQLPVGVLLGEFFAYWMHRACHRSPLLWRLHALHHSSERMYVFAAARNHPMNAILMHTCHVLPLALLGAPPELLALSGVLTGVHGLLQHCNVDLKHGWFNLVFATADAHRWHHSADREESDSNFGNNLIVWDWIFGTRRVAAGRPAAVGLGEDGRHVPHNFLWHLATPVLLHRWTGGGGDTVAAGGAGADLVDVGVHGA